MATRVLHCGNSLENYYTCINQKVAGFTRRIAAEGDIVYLAVKVDKVSYCGARAVLSSITDFKPWEDAERYAQAFMLIDIEYCTPFNLQVLSEAGGQFWAMKYMQISKTINDECALQILVTSFSENITDSLYQFPANDEGTEVEAEVDPVEVALTEESVNIMGTFQYRPFINESDKTRGLEVLVNNNFYNLFPQFPENRSLLIPENRKFITAGISNDQNGNVTGIQGIPDALLIVFNKDFPIPLQINLIEYECYGEQKIKAIDKFNYLNGHIIPQLMRFASNFSIVTDKQLRDKTIKSWTEKIVDHISENDEISKKVFPWILTLKPDLKQHRIALELQNLLLEAFQANLRIMLIIDELTDEQKDTIKNILNSFKLERGNGIQFIGHIVRLEEKVNLIDSEAEYALSVQTK